jgi:carbonic anhydrase
VAAKNVACTNLYVTWEGVDYTLLQMHFHSPSEHTIGNGRYSAEAHMVHQSAKTGGYLVIGVMLQVDSTNSPADLTADDANEYDDGVNRNNAFLNSIWTAGNKAAKAFVPNSSPNLYVTGSTSVFMNPYKDLTPGSKSMYHYFGGLTTPPCVVPGGVNWWVYDTPVMISANDLYYLRRIVQVKGNYLSNRGDNSRPVQALNGRLVMYIPAVPAAQTTPSTPATTTTTTSSSSSTAEKDTYNTAIALGGVAIAFVGLVVFALLFIFYVLFCQQKK